MCEPSSSQADEIRGRYILPEGEDGPWSPFDTAGNLRPDLYAEGWKFYGLIDEADLRG